MADEHTRRMFEWRAQVGADHSLTRFDFRVAYAIAEHTYRDTGRAQVSQAQLACGINATTRGLQKSLRRLTQGGHLRVEDNSRRGKINRYWPIIRSGLDEKPGADLGEGTNAGSHPPDETPKLPFVSPTNHSSERVRTSVRTKPLTRASEGSSETYTSDADVIAAFEEWWRLYPKHVAKATPEKPSHGSSSQTHRRLRSSTSARCATQPSGPGKTRNLQSIQRPGSTVALTNSARPKSPAMSTLLWRWWWICWNHTPRRNFRTIRRDGRPKAT
jgi:hypothetical protein